MTRLTRTLKRDVRRKVIFTDFFDTLVHRTVHPNYALKLWAKFLIRELGLSLTSDALYDIRNGALAHLSRRKKLRIVEVPYDSVIREVYERLVNSDKLSQCEYGGFENIFKQADFEGETAVQFKNEELIEDLAFWKKKGYSIYLITDFHLSEEIIHRLLKFHDISDVFDGVFVSCTLQKSKETGTIYPHVLELTNTSGHEAIMLGDNYTSDVENAEKFGIQGVHLKHVSHKFRNKHQLFGNNQDAFKQACKDIETRCRKSPHPFSTYIFHFYFFTERLYIKARQEGLKNLHFLAREGQYLKRLFDAYQEMLGYPEEARIKTHYLKMSRQSSIQISLKPLHQEDFSAFKARYGALTASLFMDNLQFPERIQRQIIQELGEIPETPDKDFISSETFARLKGNPTFASYYETHRKSQKKAFNNYLDSYGVDFREDGMHLVDVGWGGTMQENLYHYFEEEIPVTGYYLGLKEIYNIQPDTKRYGLNFSVYPGKTYSDDVLMANGQLYEQLLGASHGSTLCYTDQDPDSYAVLFHEKNEKEVFEKLVHPVQEYMFEQFKDLFEVLRPIEYSQEMVQDYITDLALRAGIFTRKKNVEFVDQLSAGFYQNVGENKVGINYSPSQIKTSKLSLLLGFIRSPEKIFRYLVKVKPFLYAKGLYWLSWPIHLSYYYIKFNFWFKKKWLSKGLVS